MYGTMTFGFEKCKVGYGRNKIDFGNDLPCLNMISFLFRLENPWLQKYPCVIFVITVIYLSMPPSGALNVRKHCV